MAGPLILDGSHGEGGGQILRTALALSAISGRPLRIERIREGRPKPGLAAQHITAIRAAAAITGAALAGDSLGSATLAFEPRHPPASGAYAFDVSEAREGSSAGAATLVLQTLALPLALASGVSRVTVKGGTHVPWSLSFDFFDRIWLRTLARLGLRAAASLDAWGFYPAGGGAITLDLAGSAPGNAPLLPLTAVERGALVGIEGHTVAANLQAHIAQRMADRADALLRSLGGPLTIRAERVRALSPGAWTFLHAAYERADAGFGSLGRRGKPSEVVAEEAVTALLDHHRSGAALDHHLADQVLLPLAFAGGPSEFTCSAVTRHLETNAWVIERFGAARTEIERRPDGTGHVRFTPSAP